MSYLPQSNVTLVALLGQGNAEDYDESETDATLPLWSGQQDAYVDQKQTTQYDANAGAMKYVRAIMLYVSLDWAGPLDLSAGQYVEFTTASASPHRHRIMDINYPVLAEQGPLAGLFNQAVSIALDPAPIEVDDMGALDRLGIRQTTD
jgi:hypothetical protein